MPTTNAQPQQQIELLIGFNNTTGVYTLVNANNEPVTFVDRIGGRPPLDVRWVIKNRAGHPITVHLRNFARGQNGLCPVSGGDIVGCEYESKVVANGGEIAVDSALVRDAGPNGYSYEVYVEHAETQVGNVIDPELQIDE